ncbi:glycosyltransferase family 2 protein [Collinsella ihumii]|uniref:Glycosyltransferase family 2 protein n=1 Tax=Collinsella ihumii TaxID=1720204 RepID=A0ABT7XH40_9ACTN|nr:glycosyltransferase family 2 protein [Collinsella ihumii]MDN0064728.1 glycosyltransferase family 2 protein [Collinsella ihumii]
MGLLIKILMKAARAALRSGGLYRMVRKWAVNRGRTVLPSTESARTVLENASPRPAACDLPASRDWPSDPEADVTIIIPCYNARAYVEKCVRSVLGQRTSRSVEVIAVDDGSTDGTGDILDRLALDDVRLCVIHQSNRGFSGARNIGISKARGALISFVDSDDMLVPNAIETLCREYDKGGCDFVTADYLTVSADGSKHSSHKGQRSHGAPWGRIYSREVWRRIEFPEGFWFEDTVQAFCIDPIFRNRYIDEELYEYRKHRGSISKRYHFQKKGLDTYWVIEEMLRWCEQLGIGYGQHILDQVVMHMGPLMLARTVALTKEEKLAMFTACCSLLASISEFEGMGTTLGDRWDDVLIALRTSNYALWCLAATAA